MPPSDDHHGSDGIETDGIPHGDASGASTCATRIVGDHRVLGVDVDAETRCVHYDSERDVVAIAFACCGEFYPCHACHETCTAHEARVWPQSRFDEHAILCGACTTPLTIEDYLACDDTCPSCGHAFNPGCAAHADRYFEV